MRVLLASDGSSDSRKAARWLRDLSLPSDTRVSVVTVATLTEPPRDSHTMSELRERGVAAAGQTAERAARIVRRRWPEVDTVVMQGDPRVEIVDVAKELSAGLIVLGARGLGPVERSLVGSTALAVGRYAPCPVAIVRGRPRPVGRILVAVDGSEGSRAALRFLSVLELMDNVEVSLLHVRATSLVPGLSRAVRSAPGKESAEHRQEQEADAEAVLADAAAELGKTRRPAERLVTEGDPAREIIRVARSRDVDLVVLGARGLRTISRLLLGSVSETVLHHVGRPAMIVRER